MKPESWPDGPPKTATQGQLEAGPALTEIEPHVTESFLVAEGNSNAGPLQLTGQDESAGESPAGAPESGALPHLDGCEPTQKHELGLCIESEPLKEAHVPAV